MRSTSTAAGRPSRSRTSGTSATSRNESMGGGIGWYRKDFELPDADSALAWAFRFESVNYRSQVWLNGRRSARTPAPTSRSSSADRPQAHAARTGSSCASTRAAGHRLPARRPEHRRRPDRRLVELLRHPARGLPAQARHGRLPEGPGAPGDRLRHVRGERAACASTCATSPRGQRVTITGKFGNRNAEPRHEDARPGRDRVASRTRSASTSRGCGRRRPRTSTTSASPCATATQGRGLRAAQRDPLDQGLQRPAGPQRRSRSTPRRRPARGLQGAGLRDRQRPPRAAGQRRPRSSARRSCARTTRCTRTRTSSRTGSAC